MNLEKYKNPIPYPNRLTKPRIPLGSSSSYMVKEYAEELAKWESAMEKFKAERKVYDDKDQELERIFRNDALQELGYDKLPEWQQNRIYAYAYEQGHSGGLSEIWNVLDNMTTLFFEKE